MIIFMYRIAVTNRNLCRGDFLSRVRELAKGSEYQAILLREKDMTETEYRVLAEQVLTICSRYGKKCILHNFVRAAEDLGHPCLHLPLPVWEETEKSRLKTFSEIGTSVHSLEQAKRALSLGASYITAGHIFTTDCKRGLPPRGLSFLREICTEVSIPVYGIDGINRKNEELVTGQGAAGVCIMSGAMV